MGQGQEESGKNATLYNSLQHETAATADSLGKGYAKKRTKKKRRGESVRGRALVRLLFPRTRGMCAFEACRKAPRRNQKEVVGGKKEGDMKGSHWRCEKTKSISPRGEDRLQAGEGEKTRGKKKFRLSLCQERKAKGILDNNKGEKGYMSQHEVSWA